MYLCDTCKYYYDLHHGKKGTVNVNEYYCARGESFPACDRINACSRYVEGDVPEGKEREGWRADVSEDMRYF